MIEQRAPVCVCLHLLLACCHMIQPLIPSRQPTSSNAPFEVELDELCCIKQNKSTMCFYENILRTTKARVEHLDGTNGPAMMSVYTVSVCVCVVTVPGTLRPISRSYRCYLTKPTQTLFSSFSSFLFCLVPWQTRGPGGPWPNRWETHFKSFFLLLLHVAVRHLLHDASAVGLLFTAEFRPFFCTDIKLLLERFSDEVAK